MRAQQPFERCQIGLPDHMFNMKMTMHMAAIYVWHKYRAAYSFPH